MADMYFSVNLTSENFLNIICVFLYSVDLLPDRISERYIRKVISGRYIRKVISGRYVRKVISGRYIRKVISGRYIRKVISA